MLGREADFKGLRGAADTTAGTRSEDAGREQLHLEASWAAVVDASRASFVAYWNVLFLRAAHVAGTDRDMQRGLEASRRRERSQLSQHGLPFVLRWATDTSNGRAWLKEHQLPVPERRPRPPREGAGSYRFANGDVYRGEFHRCLRHGQGVYSSPARRLAYDGQWLKDQRSGSGVLTLEASDGQVLYTYDGQWLADARHGRGSCVHRGKEKYSGEWFGNRYHGMGTLVDADGCVSEGDWQDGQLHGVAKQTSNGDIYTGEFRAGQRHGKGQLVRAAASRDQEAMQETDRSGVDALLGSECVFEGQWSSGERHGHGQAIYQHGEYSGSWASGYRHGQGTLSNEGYQLEGPWVGGVLDEDGQHLLFCPGGAKFTGSLRCRSQGRGKLASKPMPSLASAASWWMVPEGRGLLKTADGQLFEGEYRDGLLHGQGLALGADRSKYEGQFALGE